ncbi:MAG TPA: GAF domain-containing protein, partial [Blastocatellia bacterium]|nr:GAF domain-containing protein [Blastocatellia bacterium]
TLVQTVGRLCRADQVYMFHLRHDLWHLIADHGLSIKAREFFKTNPSPGRGSTSGRAATELRAVSIADVLQDPEYTLGQGQAIAGYRSTLGVPLLSENRLIGVFSIARTRVEPFASKEIELATSFADQAVIAIENARLFNETQEALERQTATSEVLQVINSSPRELAPVFDAMLKRAMRLCEAAFGGLWVFEGEHYVAKALCGVPSAYAAYLDQTSVLPGPHTAPYRFLQGERSAIQNVDLAAEEPYLAGDPQRRALVDLGGARSALQAPLIRDEKVLGVITVYRQETGSFSGQHVTLIQNFAEQAAIAIENARLFNEVQNKSRDLEESLQQQTATAEVLRVINSSPGHLEPVFEAMLEKATHLCEASFGILWLCDGEQFRTAALHGVPPAYAEITRTPIRPLPTNPLGRMLRGERLIVSADVSDEEPYRTGDPARRALVDLAGARSVIQVALAKEETFLGSLTVYRKEVRPFSEKQIALLQNFAAQAVIAIENVKLFEQVQAKTHDLEESLQQQTATADVLKAISRSAFDLDSVLSTLVGSAAKLCEAERGLIFLLKGNLYHTSANFGFSPELEAFARANPLPADGKSTTARAGASGSPVQAVDLLADETQGFLAREYQRLGGHRTNLGVPLRRDGETIGVFTLTRQTVQAFTPRQIELVQTFADQAVIAIENSRLLEQVQAKTRDLEESLQQQTATADVLKAISRSAFDLKAVLNALIEAAARLCEADQGTIARRQGQVFVRVATWGFSDEFARMVGAMPVVPDRGSAVGRALLERATVHIPNVDRDPEYNFTDAKRLGRFKTIVAVPMLREGAPIGVLSLTRMRSGRSLLSSLNLFQPSPTKQRLRLRTSVSLNKYKLKPKSCPSPLKICVPRRIV